MPYLTSDNTLISTICYSNVLILDMEKSESPGNINLEIILHQKLAVVVGQFLQDLGFVRHGDDHGPHQAQGLFVASHQPRHVGVKGPVPNNPVGEDILLSIFFYHTASPYSDQQTQDCHHGLSVHGGGGVVAWLVGQT